MKELVLDVINLAIEKEDSLAVGFGEMKVKLNNIKDDLFCLVIEQKNLNNYAIYFQKQGDQEINLNTLKRLS